MNYGKLNFIISLTIFIKKMNIMQVISIILVTCYVDKQFKILQY